MYHVLTVPVLSQMVKLDIYSYPVLQSLGASPERRSSELEISVIVPWPEATMAPEFEVTDMPEMEPVDTVPELSPMAKLDSHTDPVLEFSFASTEPSLVQRELSVIVPSPDATIAHDFEFTD